MSLEVLNPGPLSLLQDRGRFGQHQIGLTTGGPLDPLAFCWANLLCDNEINATTIETSIGGLKLKAHCAIRVAVTGADMPLTLNGQPAELWRSHCLQSGDTLELGYSQNGCRSYVAVSGGFAITPQFGSTATVVREGVGGLDGSPLKTGDRLPCQADRNTQCWQLATADRPRYAKRINLRVIPGYQQRHFSNVQQQLFFSNTYIVSDRCDRMGYRLSGQPVKADIEGIVSEGICLGAIQVPADGQPIVLLQDRQTIGGYPKIGSVLSLDLAALAQRMPGDSVCFERITIDDAHNALHLAQQRLHNTRLQSLS